MTTKTKVHVRWTIRGDMRQILLIDQAGFPGESWSEDDYLRFLRQRQCIGLSAEDAEGRIVGFCLYMLQKRSYHLVRLAVAPDRREQGIARAILTRLVEKCRDGRRPYLTADVPEECLAMQLALKATGWVAPSNGIDHEAETYRMVHFGGQK